METWNSEPLAKGILEALTWLCMSRAELLGSRGEESRPHGLLEKSLGKGCLNSRFSTWPFPSLELTFIYKAFFSPFGFSFDLSE